MDKKNTNKSCPYCRGEVHTEIKKIDVVDWEFVSYRLKLSEEFIEKFQDKVGWELVSKRQKQSEKYQEKIHWGGIFNYQTLSEKFIKKFQR